MNEKLLKWDKYFYDMCNIVASNSKCLSRKIGSVLVKDNNIISTGYNGPARNIPHCGERYIKDDYIIYLMEKKGFDPNDKKYHSLCPRRSMGFKSGEGIDICIAGHSERNALISAARNGIQTKGAKLYMNCPISCTPCLIEIINAGVEEIIVTSMDVYDNTTPYILKHMDLKVRIFSNLPII